MNIIRWIAGAIITLAAVAFAVANIDMVSVIWSPLHEPFEMPLSLLCLATFAVGFVSGSLLLWLKNWPVLLERRRQKRQIEKLRIELAGSERQIPVANLPYNGTSSKALPYE